VITALKNKDLNIFGNIKMIKAVAKCNEIFLIIDPSSSLLSSPSPVFITNSSEVLAESITLNDILVGRLAPRLFNGTWISDNMIAYYDDYSNLCILKVNTGKKFILIPYHKIV
jgi:hypothetical protein